jgi:hypothetical protein
MASGKVDLQWRPGGERYCYSYKLDAQTYRTRNPPDTFASERACPGQPRTFFNPDTCPHELFNLRMPLDSCQDLARYRRGSPLEVCRV